MNYFERFWNETTGEDLTDSWGTSTYYFETDNELNVIRQIQVFEAGKVLKYTENFLEDEFGMLSDQPLDDVEFAKFKISKDKFLNVWNNLERKIS